MPVTRAMAAAQAMNKEKSGQAKSDKHPPRKRTKFKGQTKKRTKKANLGRLLDMPPEVFNEIAIHLLPADLLSLARSNKFFRQLFMSRTSQRLWKRTFENVPDLPPCPPHLNEPTYVSLLFSKTCSSCGARVLRRMDPYLYVRLCNSCRDKELMEMEMFDPLLQYLPKSDVINQARLGYVYTLRSEFAKIRNAADQSEEGFIQWQKDKFVEMDKRHEHSVELESYLDMLEDEREMELDNLRMERQIQIDARLFKAGWTERDMEPSPGNATEWHKLVSQPKPITDRIWANLYPKLRSLLESNRAYNQQLDKYNRRRARIKKLQGLVESIRIAVPPLVRLTLKAAPNDSVAGSSSSPTDLRSASDYPDTKIDQPFPAMAELLTWPMIKNIVENDTSPEDAEIRFKEIRDEFDRAVVEWREKIEEDLVKIWNTGRDGEEEENQSKPSKRKGKGKAIAPATKTNTRKTRRSRASASESTTDSVKLDLPEFVSIFTKSDGTTTTNLSDLSPNLQLLLRADTVFKSTTYVSDHTYPAIVPRAGPYGIIIGGPDELMYGERWDASAIRRDDETAALAKVMLALIDRPDATSVEMKALGGNFMCGRCNRTLTDSWDDLVSHFATEQSQWKQAQEKIKAEPKAGFVFNSTHDLDPGNPKPFAHFLTPKAASDYVIANSEYDMAMTTCMRCEKMGIQARYFHAFDPGFESPMKEHLHDVHDVTEVRAGIDFRRWENDVQFFDPFESSEEDYASDEEMWGPLD